MADITGFKLLANRSEITKLILAKNWSNTTLGAMEDWPQSLCTTLSIILNSKFPMFLFWGPELICFYNDAYRPSLGENGKHPDILGGRAEDYWVEIWPDIKPIIDHVLAGGEASWSEDLFLPIFRNNRIEDVYWTFSYSAVSDESGKPAGVFVTCNETTAKLLSDRQFAESKQKLQFAIDAAELATWDINLVTNKFTGNERLLHWHGLKQGEDLNLETGLNTGSEKDRQKLIDALATAAVYSTGGILDIEYSIINQETGELKILRNKGKASFNEDNKPYRIDGILMDVTAEVRARKKTEESKERLNIIIDANQLAPWELNLKTDTVEHTGAYPSIFGYTAETLPTRAEMAKLIHPEDAAIRDKALQEAFITGVLHYVVRCILDDTTVHWVEANGKIFYDSENKPEKIFGTFKDITKKMQQAQQLKESEQKFRLLADAMPHLVWTADTEGNLDYFNEAFYEYSGTTPGSMKKSDWFQLVHFDDSFETVNRWVQAVKTGEEFVMEHRLKHFSGEYRWHLTRAIANRDSSNNVVMWICSSIDNHDQKTFTDKLEKQVVERTRQLEQKNQELKMMNQELESFTYIASHDLQEPLRKIQTFASHLIQQEKHHLSEEGKDRFQRIQNAAKNMQTLIDDLLSYSQTSSGERHFKRTDLARIVKEVETDLEDEIKEKGATIEITGNCEMNIIHFQFRQLMYNLFSNALKFSNPQRLPQIKIESRTVKGSEIRNEQVQADKKYCHIAVSDNGIGFDPIYKEKIFVVFQRLHGKSEYNGTGIGLAIVKKIVDNHNGIITASSQLNQGATFNIYIPEENVH